MGLTVTTVLIALVVWRLLYEYRRDRGLPPGPRRLPLIGNLHQAPQVLPWRTFDAWCKRYGPIVSAQFGGQTTIFISDAAIAKDLLDKRSNIYSDRPWMVMARDNVTKGMHLLIRPYDERYKLHQRMEAPVLAPRASSTYLPIQDLESKQLLRGLLSSNNFTNAFERYSSSVLFALAYGFRLETGTEPEIDWAREVQDNFVIAARVGTWIVDAIPILNHLPPCLAPWKRFAEKLFKVESEAHIKSMNRALASDSWNWTKEFSKSKQSKEMNTLEFAYDLGILVNAGFETTTTAMNIFVLATQAYPAFVASAQEELDRVVGHDRLPGWQDKNHLPYIQAVVEETLRWRPLAPQGVPHATTREDTYNGYRIPKGATIIPLFWSMCQDENHFDRPLEFRPERWLTASDDPNRFSSYFGYGRRICTGRHIARNSLFMLIARMLWGFNISRPRGPGGKPVPVDDLAFGSGFVSGPDPFEVVFEPRSEHAREVMEREWELTEKDLGVLMDGVKEHQKSLGLEIRA
ncbi:cytochrome P450 oxidoreductase [Aspergillus taichungensis]|uniref:Cytochrome P450 oxidoreductase n=1 Tax=Aspergillus taichungensis TaxID=482145 RepID=A0A2J5I833_9EURO|nr:cytochrome P450 oxidoreductase [Aspergillus taichungensis]